MNTRKKLKKLLGKELLYTGIVGDYDEATDKVCVTSICHNGKEVTDHVWLRNVKSLQEHPRGTRVKFKATANTYTDSRKKRKHGLMKCKLFTPLNEAYDEMVAVEFKDLTHRRRR